MPVSEIQSILSYWLTSYDLDPAELEDVMAEENTVRFDTLAPPEQEVPLLLEDATFFDDMQMMILRVARCTDASMDRHSRRAVLLPDLRRRLGPLRVHLDRVAPSETSPS